jgi:hypothetical protein
MRKLIELASWTVLALVGQTTVLSGRAEDLSVRAKDLSSEEESLVEQGKMMEAYRPNEHSGHHIEEIRVQGQSQWSRVVTFIFGIEDATGARAEGGLTPKKRTVEKCSSARVERAEGNEEESI